MTHEKQQTELKHEVKSVLTFETELKAPQELQGELKPAGKTELTSQSEPKDEPKPAGLT